MDIWDEPDRKQEYVQVIDGTHDFSRSAAVRFYIPDLRRCSLTSLRNCEDSVGSLICFHAGKNDYKEVNLSYSFLRSFLSRKLCMNRSSDFEEFVNERCFELRQRNLSSVIFNWNIAMGKLRGNDDILEMEEKIMGSNVDIKLLNECAKILSHHSKQTSESKDNGKEETFVGKEETFLCQDLRHVVRVLSEFGENFYGSESITNMTERVTSKLNSLYFELEQQERNLHDLTADIKRKEEYLLKLSNSLDLQTAVIKKKPFSKEDAIEFAMKQPCYLDHVRNFVGDSNRIYLLVFSSNPGTRSHVRTMDELGDWLDLRLNACCQKRVKVFYFLGKFTSENVESGISC